MEKIPTEIWHEIFSLVSANQKDAEDVSSCRLACKKLEEQSRPFLISRLCFAFRRRSDMRRLEQLAALPHLAETVHTLIFDARVYVPWQSDQHEFRSILSEYSWIDVVARVLPKFNNVRVVETATETLEQESPKSLISFVWSDCWEYVLDFLAVVARTRSTGLDKIEAMTLGSPEEGLAPTDIIDYSVRGLPDDCARFLSSQKKYAPAAMLSIAFQGLVSLRMSLYIKEWELDEIRWLRPMWQSCRNTLETLTLGLVWALRLDETSEEQADHLVSLYGDLTPR